MPRQIPTQAIISAIHKGYTDAQDKYECWSGGYWLWQAPEYLITIAVSERLFSIEGAKYLTLENGAASAIYEAGARGSGKLSSKIRPNGKIDILLWWGYGSPRSIIEIKNQIFSKNQFKKDIERIASSLNRKKDETTLQLGFFSFYESASDGPRKCCADKVKDRIEKIFRKSQEIGGVKVIITKHISKIHVVDDSAWASACLLIKPING